MTGILGGGSNAKQKTAIGSLQFQTSQKGGAIPLVYGTTRVAPNLINYDDFTATPATSGVKGKGGGGGKTGNQQYNYSASVILGVCQGPVAGFGTVWWDKNSGPLSGLPGLSTLNLGADGQASDPFWITNHPATALGYSGTANFTLDNYQLGMTASLPNFSVEIRGLESASGINGFDANPAAIVTDFLTNPRYGAGFPAASLDSLSTYSQYCAAAGLFLSPLLDTQQEAQQSLGDIVKITNSAIVWSGALLKILPYGDQALNATYTVIGLSGTIVAGDTLSLTFANLALSGLPITVIYSTSLADQTSYTSAAAGLAQQVASDGTLSGYGIHASCSVDSLIIVQTQDAGTTITGSASGGETITVGTTSAPYTFTPNTSVVYSLTEDDFIVQESSVGTNLGVNPGGPALRQGAGPITGGFTDDPVHIVRSTPADANNMIEVECLDRSNSYNTTIVEAFDQVSIDLYGVRRDTSLKANAIVDPTYTGPIAAQLLLQRSLYFRNTYSFQLGWKYCLLEPMDLVQISDVRLGATALTVRVTAVEEDDEGTLSITAEDFFGGYSTAVFYPKQGAAGYVPNYNSAPGPVNPPLIFEPPAGLLSGDLEIWVGLSGGSNWGSAQVWISSDGSSYALAGMVDAPATQGVSTADLPPHASPDTANTLSIDLTDSRGTLVSVSAIDAQNLVTLSYVGGELLAYETATLIGASEYNLTTLYRGAYGTTIADHPLGAQFSLLNGAIGHFPYPANLIGQTIYLKFVSLNIVGGGIEDLASVPAYTYTITGAGQASVDVVTGTFVNGKPTASLVLQRYVFASTVTFPTGLTGSQGTAGTAATAMATFEMQKNGVDLGAMEFAAAATTATFTMTSPTTFNAGDVLTLVAPAIPDATLANLAWTFMGTMGV
jgi:Putative phage tail protein